MNRTQIKNEIFEYFDSIETINTHSHYLAGEKFTLDKILARSYASWCGIPVGDNKQSRENYFRTLGNNTYLYWLRKSLESLYGGSLSADTWEHFDAALIDAYSTPNHSLDILKKKCRYRFIVNDAYQQPGTDWGINEILTPTFRVNMFFFGYSPTAVDHSGNNPFQIYGWDSRISLTEYVDMVKAKIIEKKATGCVALKSALAYDRGLDFAETSLARAEKAFMNTSATEAEIVDFQNFLYYEICKICAEVALPFQNHTGLGLLANTNGMNMLEAISKNPDTMFCLMHGNYPWCADLLGLMHNHRNVYADTCWLPLISTSACERFLNEAIEVGNLYRITWGCDTWSAEESYGALLAMRHVLASVLSTSIENGFMDMPIALEYISHIMYKNPEKIFQY